MRDSPHSWTDPAPVILLNAHPVFLMDIPDTDNETAVKQYQISVVQGNLLLLKQFSGHPDDTK